MGVSARPAFSRDAAAVSIRSAAVLAAGVLRVLLEATGAADCMSSGRSSMRRDEFRNPKIDAPQPMMERCCAADGRWRCAVRVPEAVPGECTDRTRGPHTARACSSHELAARLVWAAVLDTRWELGRAPTKRDGVLRALHRRLAALAVPTHGSPAISHRRRRAEAHDTRSQSAHSVVAGDLGRGASRFVGVRPTRSAIVRAGARALSRHPHGLVPYAALPGAEPGKRGKMWTRACVASHVCSIRT